MNPGRIEMERAPGEARWRLPCRDLGKARRLGWAGVAGCGALFGMAYLWGGSLARNLVETAPADIREWTLGDVVSVLFLIPAVFLVLLGLRVLWTGWVVLGNRTRTEVRATREWVGIREYLGGWRRKRKIHVNQIVKLEVARGILDWDQETRSDPAPWVPEDLWSLGARLQNGKRVPVVLGYPRGVIQEISSGLALQLPLGGGVELMPEPPVPDKDWTSGSEKVEVRPPPANTRVEMMQAADGVGFSIPAMGLLKGSHGMFVFGVMFNLFPAAFLVALLVLEDSPVDELLLAAGFLSVFFIIGTAVMLAGIAMGTRKTLIATGGGRLRVESDSVFGHKEREWAAGEIAALEVENTGTRVNNKALSALYVRERNGKRTAWLKMLSREEQKWIVGHLHHALAPESDDI